VFPATYVVEIDWNIYMYMCVLNVYIV
jgi:hypothetical protein